MPIDLINIYENGLLLFSEPYSNETVTFSLNPSIDSYYVVEVKSETSMAPIYNEKPWAMGAAFFLDIDNNGWVPPSAETFE